jgi:hypothetical protein
MRWVVNGITRHKKSTILYRGCKENQTCILCQIYDK